MWSWPRFLPDGQSLLYTKAKTATAESHVVMWHPLDGGEPVELLQGSAPQFVPPNRLLFARAGTLFTVMLDLATKRVIGDPAIVIDRVMYTGTNATPQYTASHNGDVYYIPGGLLGLEAATLARVSPDAAATAYSTDTRDYVDLRYSPDGRRLALHIADQEDDIWVLDVARGVLTRVTFAPGEDETPAWSPDGTELAFGSTHQGEIERTIRIKRADGTGEERVVWKYAGHAHVSDWSPDGRWLVIDVVTPGRGIRLLDLKDGQALKPYLETTFDQSNGRVSPDGQRLAYMSNESGRYEIYLQSFPEPGHKIQVSKGGGITPVWSRDGSRLFYRSDTQLMAVDVTYKPELAVSVSRPVLPDTYARPLGQTHTSFDLTREGDFVFVRPASPEAVKATVNGVLNLVQDQR